MIFDDGPYVNEEILSINMHIGIVDISDSK